MRIVLLGPPGSGKGTQAGKLSENLDLPHIGMGDMLREAVRNEAPVGKKVKEFMNSGRLVPDSIILELLVQRMEETKQGFVLDGFPRTLEQARRLDTLLEKGKKDLDAVFNLKVKEQTILKRLEGRLVCSECGKVYQKKNLDFSIRICPNCGVPLYQRKDDVLDTLKQRVEVYLEHTRPVIDYYRRRGVLKDISGEGSPHEVFNQILKLLS